MPELRKRPAPKDAIPPPEAKRATFKVRGVTAAFFRSGVETVGGKATAKAKAKKGETKTKAEAGAGNGIGDGDEVTKPVDESLPTEEVPDTAEGVEESSANVKIVEHIEKGMVNGPLSSESVGSKINLGSFDAVVKTHSGTEITLSELLDKSDKGVVLFTYPKASTPGCTTQACLFRDSYKSLQDTGLDVYGLSGDSPRANTTFVTKQKLPFELLCDPDMGLIGGLGLKKSVGKGTLRGSVVVSKEGVVEVWCQAGPAKTLEAVVGWVEGGR